MTPAGTGPRPHRHHEHDEDFYVLDGEVEFASGDETVTVHEGGYVRVPRGAVHRYTVTSDQPCRMLVVLTPPGGVEDFWREIGVPVTDPSNSPLPPGSSNFEEVAAIARRYGMEFVGS